METNFLKKNYKIKGVKGSLLLLLFSFLFLFPLLALRAQVSKGQIGVAITPLVFEFDGNKGEKVAGKVKVMNTSYDSEVVVKMESEDIFPEGEEGRVRLEIPPEERAPFSLSHWIKFNPERFNLAPREEKEIDFEIEIPEYAEPGGHYASIIGKVEGFKGPGGTGVSIVPRVASLILLTVPGEFKEGLSVASFKTSKSYYEYGPIKFEIRLQNKGSVHLKPNAKIEIKNILGKKVGEVIVEPHVILPGGIRKFESSFDKKWFFGGRYKAVLTGNYGIRENFEIPQKEIIFWAFPWKVGLAVLILLILITFFFIATRKRWSAALSILLKGKFPEEIKKDQEVREKNQEKDEERNEENQEKDQKDLLKTEQDN